MNKCIIMGRLTKDPEIRYTTGENAVAVAKWSVAVDRRFSKGAERQADFFDCTAFGKLAEHMEKYWKKGMKILLIGRLEQSQWRDKEGKPRSAVGINVEEVEFCERKDAAPQEESKTADFVPASVDEDIPFKF